MRLQQWPSFAWELFALCFHQRRLSLTDALLNNAIPCSHQRGEGCGAAPRRIRGAGPLWLARAEHRCQLPSVMIAYLWTFNLSKACCLAEGSRRFGVLNRFDNRHYHCEGPGEKRHQRVNCGWKCKLSLLISFNTTFASFFLTSFSLMLANIWKYLGRCFNPWTISALGYWLVLLTYRQWDLEPHALLSLVKKTVRSVLKEMQSEYSCII